MTRTITLAAAESVDIGNDWARLRRLQVENRAASVGTLYYGETPVAVQVQGNVESIGDLHLTLGSEAENLGLRVGMILTTTGGVLDSNTVITSISGRTVNFAGVPSPGSTGADVYQAFTATAPAISETNGHELAPGQRESFAHGDFQTGRAIRLLAGTGGCTVTITEARN